MNWPSLLSSYALVYAHHSDNTRYLTARWLDRFHAFCESRGLALHDVQRGHHDTFQAQLLWMQGPHGQLFTPHTVYQGVRMVRAFLRWAVAQKHLAGDPTSGWILPRPATPIRVLTADEVHRLLACAPVDTVTQLRNRALVALLVGTGLRTGVCQRLTLDDVDVERATVTVHQGKARTLSLATPMLDALATYLAQARPRLASRPDEPALFLGQDGRPLSRGRINQIVVSAGREAGLSGLTPVVLRYTFADQARQKGANEKAVRTQLGIGRAPLPPTPQSPPKPTRRKLFSRPERRKQARG